MNKDETQKKIFFCLFYTSTFYWNSFLILGYFTRSAMLWIPSDFADLTLYSLLLGLPQFFHLERFGRRFSRSCKLYLMKLMKNWENERVGRLLNFKLGTFVKFVIARLNLLLLDKMMEGEQNVSHKLLHLLELLQHSHKTRFFTSWQMSKRNSTC